MVELCRLRTLKTEQLKPCPHRRLYRQCGQGLTWLSFRDDRRVQL